MQTQTETKTIAIKKMTYCGWCFERAVTGGYCQTCGRGEVKDDSAYDDEMESIRRAEAQAEARLLGERYDND